jgi:hypothetical protein
MTKKKNNLNKNVCVLLKFIECSDKDVQNSLGKINLEGTRVSNLINRWVVDVPFWKESYYRDQLSKIDIIEKIYPNSNQRPSSRDIENYEEVEENEK